MIPLTFRRSKFASFVVLGPIILFAHLLVFAQDKVPLSVDISKPGPKVDRNIFGQFAEHLGYGVYEGIWVGPDSKIPNTRGIRNDVVAALKALKVRTCAGPAGALPMNITGAKGSARNEP